MPEATAKRTAELLIQDHPNGPFEVDFLDKRFTELVIAAFESLGCKVEHVGFGTRIKVHCPEEIKRG